MNIKNKEKTYKDLKVFKLSYELGLKIHKSTLRFPKIEQYSLSRQLRNSAMSIPVNLAEGIGRQLSPHDVVRFLKMSLGSCEETKIWLCFAKDLNYIDNCVYNDFNTQYNEVGKMLNGLIKYWLAKL